jgi:hypothetical protein
MAYQGLVDPNRHAPQPQALPPPVRLHPIGGRRPETQYVWSRLGDAVPSVVADPSVEADWLIIRLG